MLNVLRRGAPGFVTITECEGWRLPDDAVWVDLCSPTREEEVAVEAGLGLELPTREEMAAIEPSSRLYQENGATFMTATLLAHSQDDHPVPTPVTFVLARGVLVTIRYEALKAFTVFAQRAGQADVAPNGGVAFLGLLDAVVERLAEVLERTSAQVGDASAQIFHRPHGGAFEPLLTELARAQSVTSNVRGGLVSLGRLVGFAGLAEEVSEHPSRLTHLDSLKHDVQSLTEHASYQASHISFLLDAALGLISIEQNSIIKIFSVVSVVFLPPTLVASIYGMNFKHMPELDWMVGYPFAIAVMAASAILPLGFFKRKGWL